MTRPEPDTPDTRNPGMPRVIANDAIDWRNYIGQASAQLRESLEELGAEDVEVWSSPFDAPTFYLTFTLGMVRRRHGIGTANGHWGADCYEAVLSEMADAAIDRCEGYQRYMHNVEAVGVALMDAESFGVRLVRAKEKRWSNRGARALGLMLAGMLVNWQCPPEGRCTLDPRE